jgi:tetratricopeptide (TPR) repeat protein
MRSAEEKVALKPNGLDLAEALAIAASAGGAIAALVTQQLTIVAATALPLTAALVLSLANRQRLQQELLRGQLKQQGSLLALEQQQLEQQQKFQQLHYQVNQIQNWTGNLNDGDQELHDYTQIIASPKYSPQATVASAAEIESHSQATQSNPNYAKSYYNRALTHQRLGDLDAAIADYTEAVRLNPDYAKAYHNRALALVNLGDKQAALEDLRAASKYFFEQGDINSYQKAKDLSKRLHDLKQPDTGNLPLSPQVADELVLEFLFN